MKLVRIDFGGEHIVLLILVIMWQSAACVFNVFGYIFSLYFEMNFYALLIVEFFSTGYKCTNIIERAD